MSRCPLPDRRHVVDIGVGELTVGRPPDILVTSALGSCVAVALWDPFTLNGALAHVMLPKQLDTRLDGPSTRFASGAIPLMVERLNNMGSGKTGLVAKIAGGSAMFKGESAITHVGERNIEEVRAQLAELRIALRAEDVGGSHARTVELHLDSGTLLVRSYAFGIKEL